jgi:hypothetical protein
MTSEQENRRRLENAEREIQRLQDAIGRAQGRRDKLAELLDLVGADSDTSFAKGAPWQSIPYPKKDLYTSNASRYVPFGSRRKMAQLSAMPRVRDTLV